MKKLLMYSGGYDSLCLLVTILANQEEGDELQLLYFDYEQRNLQQELSCVTHMAERFDLALTIIPLPEFVHVNNVCLDGSNTGCDQYIPMRNVIFFSHALSIAQAEGIEELYFGFIAPPEGGGYCDADADFIKWCNSFSKKQGITVKAPFINLNKADLKEFFDATDFTQDSFFSCNTPIEKDGEIVPCGQCGDCELINSIF